MLNKHIWRKKQLNWNLTKTLNGDKTERAKTVLTTNSGFVTGRAAADLLARTYQTGSKLKMYFAGVEDALRKLKKKKTWS